MPLPCFRRHNSIFDAHGEKGTRVCAREGGERAWGGRKSVACGTEGEAGGLLLLLPELWVEGGCEGGQARRRTRGLPDGNGIKVRPGYFAFFEGRCDASDRRGRARRQPLRGGGAPPWGTYLRLSKGLGAINGDVWDPPDRRRHGPGGRRRGRRRAPPSGPGASAIQRKDTTYPYYIYINVMYLVGKNVPDLPPEASRQD